MPLFSLISAQLPSQLRLEMRRRFLLDDEDIGLLEEAFSVNDEEHIGWTPSIGEIAVLIAITTATLSLTDKTAILVAIFVPIALFAFFLLFALPKFLCWRWSEGVDSNFQKLHSELRQRELALFSLYRPSSSAAPPPLPLYRPRLHCYRQLCQFTREFNQASVRLVETNENVKKLLFNFISDEMHELVDGQEGEGGKETDLHTSTLKTLWQYQFLVRSEFMRVSVLALRRTILREASPIQFLKHLILFVRTSWATSQLKLSGAIGQVENNSAKGRGGPKTMVISRLVQCKAQLEWALERLECIPSAAESERWPPPYSAECRAGIVTCLEQVISALREESSETTESGNNGQEQSTNSWTNEFLQAQQERKSEPVETRKIDEKTDGEYAEDYEIFELDLSSIAAEPCIASEEKRQQTLFSSPAQSSLLFSELGVALAQRKELQLRREMRALAKARGVAEEERLREELDRTPFADGRKRYQIAEPTGEMMPVSRGPFGGAALTGADLGAILSQRAAMMKAKECDDRMEQFEGDTSDIDENG